MNGFFQKNLCTLAELFCLIKEYETKNYNKAIFWYKKAAKQGFGMDQNNLGIMYIKGLGVKKDYKKAFELFQEAAIQGNIQAQYNLGLMYYMGLSVKKDYKKAAKLFEEPAKKGNPRAQCYLGLMYATGKGVRKDENIANYYLRKSCKQGFTCTKLSILNSLTNVIDSIKNSISIKITGNSGSINIK